MMVESLRPHALKNQHENRSSTRHETQKTQTMVAQPTFTAVRVSRWAQPLLNQWPMPSVLQVARVKPAAKSIDQPFGLLDGGAQ